MVWAPCARMVAMQAFGAGIEPHALGIGAFQRVQLQALEHADALAQRRLEFELAAHGAFGDGGDLRLEAGHVGQLVQAFDIDDGGIHVGDQQFLAAAAWRDQIDVELQAFRAARAPRPARARIRSDAAGRRRWPGDRMLAGPLLQARGTAPGSAPLPMTFRTKADMLAPMKFDAVLIAGPTASGKSAAALELAERYRRRRSINADSMQVYREAPILTAQPGAADKARVPHLLYGHVSAREAYSVGRYARGCRRRAGAGARHGQAAHLCRRHRALFHGADRWPGAISRPRRRKCATARARCWRRSAWKRCMRG